MFAIGGEIVLRLARILSDTTKNGGALLPRC